MQRLQWIDNNTVVFEVCVPISVDFAFNFAIKKSFNFTVGKFISKSQCQPVNITFGKSIGFELSLTVYFTVSFELKKPFDVSINFSVDVAFGVSFGISVGLTFSELKLNTLWERSFCSR